MKGVITSYSIHYTKLYEDEKYFSNSEDYKGLPNGLEVSEMIDLANENQFDSQFENGIGVYGFAQPHRQNLVHLNAPTVILHYAEVQFLLAEAQLKGLINGAGDANALYKSGIKAGMELMEMYNAEQALKSDQVDDYLASIPTLGSNPAMGLERNNFV